MGNTSGGVPARVNRAVSDADLRIGLGMIVPHTDTGFSGAAKKADADMMKVAYFESLEAAVQSAHEETGGSDIAILTHGGISWPYLTRPDIS